MKVRRLDANKDIVFGKGRYTYLENTPETVGQIVWQRFKISLGEWWLNIDSGLDVAIADLPKEAIDTIIQERITETLGVIEILQFESIQDYETRHYTATVTVRTDYGNITIEDINI